MSDDYVKYYRQRAEAELDRAHQATRPEVVRAHHELANAYLKRIGKPVRQIEDA